MNRLILQFSLFLLICTFSNANDTFFYIAGGNIIPAEQNQTSVELREETINIELYDDNYSVSVDFIFYNSGSNENLLVGFPYLLQKQGGRTITSIYDFETWVNGLPVEYSNNSIDVNEQGLSELIVNYAFTKAVFFPSHQITTIKVRFNAGYGGEPSHTTANYYYGSGRSWDKNIGKININIKNNIEKFDAWIYDIKMPGINVVNHVKWNDDILQIELEDIEPDNNDLLQIFFAGQLWNYYHTIHTVERFRNRVGILDKYNLSLLSKAQLRILRNAYYALYGYNFLDENLKTIFSNVFSSFYHINNEFNENQIIDADRRNINMILEEERTRK